MDSLFFLFSIINFDNFEQTNVFANAQKRKVRPFEGMQRKAIVIVPSEEDYKARTEAQEKAECKDVPDNAVMEMKGDYSNLCSHHIMREMAHTTIINREY